jgi:hypothetical protein
MKIYFRKAGDHKPVCSNCEKPVDLVVEVPLLGVRLVDGREMFIRWCEDCCRSYLAGFERARNMSKAEG